MKRKMAAVLAGIMVLSLLGGCASRREAGTGSASTQDVGAGSANTQDAAAGSGSGEADSEGAEGIGEAGNTVEPVTLKLAIFNYANMDDMDVVLEKVNELTLNELNMKLEIEVIPGSSWSQQINLMLSGGEELDIFPAFSTPLATYAANGQALALDELLGQYGGDIGPALGEEYLNCGRVGGKLYGITTNRDLAAQNGYWMRADLCEKYDIDPSAVTNLDQLEQALLKIHEGEPEIYPVVPETDAVTVGTADWDDLGNGMGVLMDYGEKLEVVNLYETQEYREYVETMHRWYEEGLIMKDILNNTESSASLVRSEKGAGAFAGMKPGFEAQQKRDTGMEIARINLTEAFSVTGNAAGLTWCISSNSKNPEAAMRFLNFAYTSSELNNLLIYGIEGVHYKYVDEENNIIDYADGLDAASTPYSPTLGWAWFNQFTAAVWNGNAPDYWDQLAEFNAGAIKSGAMGYTFDSSNVKTEITACTNVCNKYLKGLNAGVLDPAEALPRFNEELKKAGLDAVIAEKQRQIDEWAAQAQ